jgi:hypothetical protein
MSYIGKQPTKAPLTASDIEDGIITAAKIEDGAVVAAEIASNAVTTAKINADAVTGAKIADDAINSEHYTDGSIDTAHIADGQITTAKLATAVFTGATDIGADIADADLFLMDDGAGGTIRKTAASRLKTYAGVSGDVTTIDSIFKTDLKIGEDDQTKIDFALANQIQIYNNNSETIRINDNGEVRMLSDNLGANPSSSNQGITFRNNGSTARVIDLGISATSNSTVVNFINGNGGVGTIQLNGSATAYNTSSDYRLKENVNYDFDATSRLKQLKPARFNFKADPDTTVDGFIAHEVSSVVPEAISGEKDAVKVWKDDEELPEGVSVGDNKLDADGNTIMDIQGIDQSKLVPLLVKTIQELEARIKTLEDA